MVAFTPLNTHSNVVWWLGAAASEMFQPPVSVLCCGGLTGTAWAFILLAPGHTTQHDSWARLANISQVVSLKTGISSSWPDCFDTLSRHFQKAGQLTSPWQLHRVWHDFTPSNFYTRRKRYFVVSTPGEVCLSDGVTRRFCCVHLSGCDLCWWHSIANGLLGTYLQRKFLLNAPRSRAVLWSDWRLLARGCQHYSLILWLLVQACDPGVCCQEALWYGLLTSGLLDFSSPSGGHHCYLNL